MASSSSSCIKRYHVFPSFHGSDVRQGFLSHLHHQFESKGITVFKDQELERGHTIGPELVKAIRESRVSIVLLSQNYASSGWCLDELVEILRCKQDHNQIVMTMFYKVDPSSVRKQKGDFGRAFIQTCEGKTEEVKKRWSKALTDVANIEGEHSLNWSNEAAMIQKVIADVSKKLNFTPTKDFDEMVGIDAHLKNLDSLLCLMCDEVKMIGIWGPAGIGKSTIARALYDQLSVDFTLQCFMSSIDGSDYDSKLSLQRQFLAKILNQRDVKVNHLGAIKEWLHDQRVLIILDDVEDQEQLEVLAKETSWFGLGSRIIITTKDKKILKSHGIKDIYHVKFPTEEEALEILYRSAFKQSSPHDGFEEIAEKVVNCCGNLPLAIRVVGSSLCGESEEEWRLQLHGLQKNLDRKIENVLRVGYNKLLDKHQSLFLHIACVFNDHRIDDVTSMLADNNLDVQNGLKTLVAKSLLDVSYGWIRIHSLLEQMGKQVVAQESPEPGKRQFLVEAKEIRDVLVNETGTASVIGISFDYCKIGEFSISGKTFKGMRSLKYLKLCSEDLRLLEDLEYLPCLRLLDWDDYPGKSLPLTFNPEHLITLTMTSSRLEKLWRGIQPLPNLKELNLWGSSYLKEIPNLSKATKLESLFICDCQSLVEIPSSISNLHKLENLNASWCIKLQVVPTNINLASLEEVTMRDCSRLRILPNLSTNIKFLHLEGSQIKEYPASIVRHWSRLEKLWIGNGSLKRLTHVPLSLTELYLSKSDIKKIPDCVIGLRHLVTLDVSECTKLVLIQGLPPSLKYINASNCISLKTACFSFHNPIKRLNFDNCVKLDEESRRRIIGQQLVTGFISLPGKEVPEEFTHKAKGNSITIPLATCGEDAFCSSLRFKACLLISQIKTCGEDYRYFDITCHLRSKGGVEINTIHNRMSHLEYLPEHLFIFCDDLFHKQNRCLEVDMATIEFVFEYNSRKNEEKIIECGVQILREEVGSINMDSEDGGDEDNEAEAYKVSTVENIQNRKHTSHWSWLRKLRLGFKCFEFCFGGFISDEEDET